ARREERRRDDAWPALPSETPARAPAFTGRSERPTPLTSAPDADRGDWRRDPPSRPKRDDDTRLSNPPPRDGGEPRFGNPLPRYGDEATPLHPPAARDASRYGDQSSYGTRPTSRPGRSYTVADGDTLFDIARRELGRASRWVEIYELNEGVLGKDFNTLAPGTRLVLPDNERSGVLAQPQSGGYRR
ncbi:MAG: LysM domain-containing protein, partial [Thermoguttaceae bacterium]